jgi:hypothetical protein
MADAHLCVRRPTCVSSCGVDSVLIADDFPELGPDLVAALAGLQVNDFSHGGLGWVCVERRRCTSALAQGWVKSEPGWGR